MADIDWLIDRVAEAEEGPQVGAFFDFDGTLIDGYSAAAFFRSRLRHGDIGVGELVRSLNEAVNVERRGHTIDELMRMSVMAQAGQRAADIDEWARSVFAKRIAGMLFPEARELIEAHRRKGHTVVVASSATPPQIRSTADELGIPNIICTEVEIDSDGYITGRLAGPIRWGQGKADGVTEFAEGNDVDLDRSYSYGNGHEDVAFLETVGHPCALNPDRALEAEARNRDWAIGNLRKPKSTTPADMARTAMAMGTLGASALGGAALALARRDRSAGANFAATVGSELGLATAGVRLNVLGQQNLWNTRPAVFLFNHQSQLDVLVLAALVRQDFTGIAKKSLRTDPFFGPIGYLGDVAFIDRSDNQKAREQLEPVVTALRGGRSIVVSPEGTRSPTARLLPFKKGPFHIAIQAGVPLVPIVIRNCGEIMAPHSFVVHSGTVDVAVLPAIDPSDWDLAELDDHIASVRGQYLHTQAHWPSH